jgi:hypothetical protein
VWSGLLGSFVVGSGLMAASCSSDKGKLRENIRPHVRA